MTPSQQAPSLVERLNELSAWLSEHNIDMRMPVGMIDPAEAAAELEEALDHWKANHADVTAKKRRQEDVVREALARAERAEAQCRVLEAALTRIGTWFGEFPEPGISWPDGSPMSYGAAFGSNGERDYMRGVARQALSVSQDSWRTAPLSGGGGAGEFAENANQGLPESHDDQHSDGGRG